MKKLVALSVIALFSVGTGNVIVEAATAYPSGGTWNYGVGITGSYSDYLHGRQVHSSTVKKGGAIDSHKVGAGVEAKSRLTIYSGCEFYYNVF